LIASFPVCRRVLGQEWRTIWQGYLVPLRLNA